MVISIFRKRDFEYIKQAEGACIIEADNVFFLQIHFADDALPSDEFLRSLTSVMLEADQGNLLFQCHAKWDGNRDEWCIFRLEAVADNFDMREFINFKDLLVDIAFVMLITRLGDVKIAVGNSRKAYRGTSRNRR